VIEPVARFRQAVLGIGRLVRRGHQPVAQDEMLEGEGLHERSLDMSDASLRSLAFRQRRSCRFWSAAATTGGDGKGTERRAVDWADPLVTGAKTADSAEGGAPAGGFAANRPASSAA